MNISPCKFEFGVVLPLILVTVRRNDAVQIRQGPPIIFFRRGWGTVECVLEKTCTGPYAQDRLWFANEVFRPVHLANLSFAFPSRPVLLVKFHEELRAFDRLFFRLQVKLRIPADNLLGLREWPVNDGDLPSLKPDAGALSSGTEPPAADHRAGFDRLFAELANGLHQFLGRKAPFLGGLNNHHESHFYFSLWFRVGSWSF